MKFVKNEALIMLCILLVLNHLIRQYWNSH